MPRCTHKISAFLCLLLAASLCACSFTVDLPFFGNHRFVWGADGTGNGNDLQLPDTYTAADYQSDISDETIDAEIAKLKDVDRVNEVTAFGFFISTGKSRSIIQNEHYLIQNISVYIPTEEGTRKDLGIIISYYYLEGNGIHTQELHHFTDSREAYAYFRRNGWMNEHAKMTLVTAAECFSDEVRADAETRGVLDGVNDFAAQVRDGRIQAQNF